MFQLSQTHNQAFQAKAEADFVREVMQYLRENHAETVVKLPNGEFIVRDLPEETLWKIVEDGIAKASKYQIIQEKDVSRFIYHFIEVLNQDFESIFSKEVLEVLRNERFSSKFKVGLLSAIRDGKLQKSENNTFFIL